MYILSVYCVVLCGIVCEGRGLPQCVVLISPWADACVLYSSANTWTEETHDQPPPSVLPTFNTDMCNTHIHMGEKWKETAKSGTLVRSWTGLSSSGWWQRFSTSMDLYWWNENLSSTFPNGGREHYLSGHSICLTWFTSSASCSISLCALWMGRTLYLYTVSHHCIL